MRLDEFNQKIQNMSCKKLFEPEAQRIGGISGKYGCTQDDKGYVVFEMSERNSPVVIHRADTHEDALDWLYQLAELEEPVALSKEKVDIKRLAPKPVLTKQSSLPVVMHEKTGISWYKLKIKTITKYWGLLGFVVNNLDSFPTIFQAYKSKQRDRRNRTPR